MKNYEELKTELMQELERLENNSYYYNDNANFKLIKKLIAGTPANDADFKEVLEDGTAIQIIELLCDCYDSESLIKWLSNNDFDVFNNYRYSDREYVENYESFEAFKEESGCFYEDEPDVLLYNEKTGVYVKSW